MKLGTEQNLRCTRCYAKLCLEPDHTVSESSKDEVASGNLCCIECDSKYPIIRSIPRFVTTENYAENFGLQWNEFRKTQLDSYSGLTISHDRFYSQSNWKKEDLKGKRVLDIGCGAGRFTEIAVESGALVYAIDYSDAVDACMKNLGKSPNLNVFQADIYNLPFEESFFDFVYCFGVLQHTPDVKKSFNALPKYVKRGGSLAVDVYELRWKIYLHPKRWLRPLTSRMNKNTLFTLVRKCVPVFLTVNRLLRRIPVVGRYLTRLVPVADYTTVYKFNKQQNIDWAILDTYDWFGPAYDTPQSRETLEDWFSAAGFAEVIVKNPNFVIGTGRKA